MSTKCPNRGFTLIELMVVLAIVGLLLTVLLFSMSESRAGARDAERRSDLQRIAVALELFYNNHKRFPSSADGSCSDTNSFASGGCMHMLVTEGYMEALPQDPLEDDTFTGSWETENRYYYDNWCRDTNSSVTSQYRLWSNSERTQSAENTAKWWNDQIIGLSPCDDPS